MKTVVSSRTSTAWIRYKHEFDKNIWRKPKFEVVDHILKGRVQVADNALDAANEMYNLLYSKELRLASGP